MNGAYTSRSWAWAHRSDPIFAIRLNQILRLVIHLRLTNYLTQQIIDNSSLSTKVFG